MTKRLTNLAPLQLGIVSAAFYAVMSLIFVPFILLGTLLSAAAQTASHQAFPFAAGFGVGMIVILPIIYGILGFILGVIAGLIYNLIAKFTGGIEFTVSDSPAGFVQ